MLSKYKITNRFIIYLYIIKVIWDIGVASFSSWNFSLLKNIISKKMKILIVNKDFNNKDFSEKIKINRLLNKYMKMYNRELFIYSLK